MIHRIEVNDLLSWLDSDSARICFASSVGKGTSKWLYITAKGEYLVLTHAGTKIVHRGTQPYPAVEAYNNII